MAVNLDEAKKELAAVEVSDHTRHLISAAFRILDSLVLETQNGPFICGHGGTKDSRGLPEYIMICPAYGAAGSCFYKKSSEYTEPGY